MEFLRKTFNQMVVGSILPGSPFYKQ